MTGWNLKSAHLAVRQYIPVCPRCHRPDERLMNAGWLCEACTTVVVLHAIAEIRLRVLVADQPPELDCCLACGCLVLPDEQCPGCRAQREKRAQRAA
jgi:hypothetical protein